MEALGELVAETRGELPPRIHGIAIDSRHVRSGYLFVAIRGENSSGEDFIGHALRNGATCLMLEAGASVPDGVPAIMVRDARAASGVAASAFYGNPGLEVPVVAVTGTNGKTTFTYLMESILKETGMVPGVIGTVDYRLGPKRWPSGLTTPDPVTLQRTMREMVDHGAGAIVMEASSHALEQKRPWGTHIRCAVFTNLTRDHLDYHRGMEAYFKAKQRLFLDYTPGVSVINVDDPYGRKLYSMARGEKISYALKNEAAIRPRELVIGLHGIDMAIELYGKTIEISSRLFGRFNACNILAATSAAFSLGVPAHAIQKGISMLESVPGRMERICPESRVLAFVDYAHTPDAVKRVLEEVRAMAPERVITVIGCGGERDTGKRPLMGSIATRLSDLTIFTSDNPRSEDPHKIIEDMLEEVRSDSVTPRGAYEVLADRKEAIFYGVSMAEPGDLIVVLGKGHEAYQLARGQKIPFDDRKVLKEALGERGPC